MRNSDLLAVLGRCAATGLVAAALAGCSMGNMFAGSQATPGATSGQQFGSPAPEQLAATSATALPAIATECPPIKVRPGGEALFKYGGQVGNPKTLHYQAVIENTSRNCVVSNGLITVRMGAVGRLLLGPLGTESQVTVPLRFAVERDGMAVFSEKYSLAVAITPPNQAAEFSKVVENVAIPYVGGEEIIIWVGFDTRG